MFSLIRHIKSSFNKDRTMQCQYCGNIFCFKETHVNHVLFACDKCKAPKIKSIESKKVYIFADNDFVF